MTTIRSFSLATALAALAACGNKGAADSITYPGYDGHVFFPLRLSAHEGLTCEECHVTGVTNPTTFKQFTCTGCHTLAHAKAATDASHAAVANYAWDSPACLKCHPEGQAAGNHGLFFPIGDPAHGRVCTACHAPDPTTRKDLAQLKCVTCHTDPARFPGQTLAQRHGFVEDYPAAPQPKDCLRCHDSSQVVRFTTHVKGRAPQGFGPAWPWDSPPPPDKRHGYPNQPFGCFNCHDAPPPAFGGTGTGIANRPWAQDWKIPATTANHPPKGYCQGCHGVQ